MANALNWVNATTDQWSAALGGNSAAQAAFNSALESGATKEDAFNSALAACSTEGERQQLVVDTLSALYGEAGTAYQETNTDLIAYNQSQDAMRQGAADLGGALMPLVSTVSSLAGEVMSGLAPAAQQAATFIGTNLNSAVQAASPLIAAASSGASLLAQNLGVIAPVLTGVTAGFVAFKAALAVQTAIQLVSTALNGMSIAQYAAATAQRVLNAAMNANPIILVVTLIASLVAALVTLYTTNEDFRNAVNNAWNTIKSTAENVFGRIKTFFTKDIPNAIKTAQEWFSNLPNNIGNALNRALNSVRAWAGNLGDQAVRAGQSFLNGVRNKFSEMLSYIGGIPGRIRSGLGNLGSTLLSAGSDLIAGLGQGVMNGIQGVVDSVSAGVQRVVDAAKGLLGIASPSRVFMEIGDYSMQGLAIGFERGERPAARAAVGTLESLMAQAASARTPMLSRASAGSAARGDTYQVIIDGDAMDASPQIERAFDAFVSALNTRYDMGVG